MKHLYSFIYIVVLWLMPVAMNAQSGIEVEAEAVAQASSGEFAPLWLSSNTHNIASPYGNAAYERISAFRTMEADSARHWKRSFGVDVVMSQEAQSKFRVHQAFAQLRFMQAILTVGAKEREADLKNNELTSGGLSIGTNAEPIPMVMGEMDYFSIPRTDHWWRWRGRLAFGTTTDGAWQERWIGDKDRMRYTSNTLYHEKAIYWRFGREEVFPLTYEIGIQMITQFGGTTYNATGRGLDKPTTIHHAENLNAFWHAFSPMGSSDVTDGVNLNAAGNTLGSYNMRLEWKDKTWSAAAYFERFYEDHSMLTLQYGIYDHLVGIDAKLPDNPIVSHALVEHISTKDQSGAVYHDGTANVPDAIAGRDNYYNHSLYTGWQHWGMAIGNPLIISPIYNDDHRLTFRTNRIQAWHIAFDGDPTPRLHWRAKATFTRNWGTYIAPFADIVGEQHYMAEAAYRFCDGLSATAAVGLSHGELVGNTVGGQVKLRWKIR